ncbi:MAG: hypothetical protein KDD92_09830 [Caldilineaceae bacterium]|nr:hypothetical protein [Caldilineaceae bacterium]
MPELAALSPQLITSLPGLAAAMRSADAMRSGRFLLPDLEVLRNSALTPMYRVRGETPEAEAAAAAGAMGELIERIRRLSQAYGEWRRFDAGAYFDLTAEQTANLLYLRERVNTVHLRFAADLLLPSLRTALDFWAAEYAPARMALAAAIHAGAPDRLPAQHRRDAIASHMGVLWQRTEAAVILTRELLADDIGYMSMRGAEDERARWRAYNAEEVSAPAEEFSPGSAAVPSLTLIFDFPLPAARQSGRLRRLRRNRTRRRTGRT